MSHDRSPPPASDDLAAANALWTFAVGLYGRPGVGEACLNLQDRGQANIPFLLFVLWLGAQRGVAISVQELDDLSGLVDGWHNEIVGGLRILRRRLKEGPYPAPTAETDGLRDSIKAAELAAEKLELNTLAGLALTRDWSQAGPDSANAAERNLRLLLDKLRLATQPWADDAAAALLAALRT